jgi:hypothetical protein
MDGSQRDLRGPLRASCSSRSTLHGPVHGSVHGPVHDPPTPPTRHAMIPSQTAASSARTASRLMHHGSAPRRPSVAYDSGRRLPPRIRTTSPPPSRRSCLSILRHPTSQSPTFLDLSREVWSISRTTSFPSPSSLCPLTPTEPVSPLPPHGALSRTLICNLLCVSSRHISTSRQHVHVSSRLDDYPGNHTLTPKPVWQRMSPLTSPSHHATPPPPRASPLTRLCSRSHTTPATPAPARMDLPSTPSSRRPPTRSPPPAPAGPPRRGLPSGPMGRSSCPRSAAKTRP